MAKPMPTLPPEGEKMAVLMPNTWPSSVKLGPPELPRLIGGVDLEEVVVGAGTDVAAAGRDDARRSPWSRARTGCRSRPSSRRPAPCRCPPIRRTGTASGRSILSRARSVLVSVPISLAGYSLSSLKMTVISSASAITWLLVTTKPAASTTKPEPEREAAARLLLLLLLVAIEELLEELLERRARAETAAWPACPPVASAVTSLRVEMLTTAGAILATRSPKPWPVRILRRALPIARRAAKPAPALPRRAVAQTRRAIAVGRSCAG